MREILFRGKRADTGEWIYGDLRQDKDLETAYIGGWDYFTADYALQREPFEYPVSPETVSQFTGLYDKNGVKIFEGDIIKQYEKTQFGDPVSDFGLVKWDNKECMLFRTSTRIGKDRLVTSRDIYEVVGNIYDNPDLLEVSKE